MKTHWSYGAGSLVAVCRNAHDARRGASRPSITRDVLAVTCQKCIKAIGPVALEKARADVADKFETRDVLAGAYVRDDDERGFLSHTVDAATERPLCNRVKAESIADAGAGDVKAVPTCPACRKLDPRFPRAEA